MANHSGIETFVMQVPEAMLRDLHERLARTRWPDESPDAGWDYGTNLAYLKGLIAYWHEAYDWRAHERLLNGLHHDRARVDGLRLHFIHEPGVGPHPLPLLLCHGWPGSIYEFHKIIGPLTDPARYGGDPQDAFSVVAPSLPGYGFSDRPRERPMNIPRLATLFAALMTDLLGYRRFGAQGGDWGAFITSHLGFAYPDQVEGIHLSMVAIPPIPLSARTCLPLNRRSSNVWKPSSGRRPAINGFRARSHRRWAMA